MIYLFFFSSVSEKDSDHRLLANCAADNRHSVDNSVHIEPAPPAVWRRRAPVSGRSGSDTTCAPDAGPVRGRGELCAWPRLPALTEPSGTNRELPSWRALL